jgi:hypothetical protein
MYRAAGNIQYPWIAVSPSDSTGTGLGFMSNDAANKHASVMNALLTNFNPAAWNMEFWKTKPEPWIVLDVTQTPS